MSKYISELLEADEPLFSIAIQELERGTGNSGVDVALTGEIIARSNSALRALGLNPRDTSAEEAYVYLQELTRLHDQFILKKLDKIYTSSRITRLDKIINYVSSGTVETTNWQLKPSALKKLLLSAKPNKAAKLLGYRSLESMIKREPLASVYFAAQFAESKTWRRTLREKYRHFKSSDFEQQNIEIVNLASAKFNKLHAKLEAKGISHPLLCAPELGTLAVAPLDGYFKKDGSSLALILLILNKIEEIRCMGTYLKLKQFDPDFSQEFASCVNVGLPYGLSVAGQPLGWRQVHKYLGSDSNTLAFADIGPHVSREDFTHRQAEELLYKIEPALHFWHGLDFAGRPLGYGRPVSFGLLDNALSLVRGLSFENRYVGYMQESLQAELSRRYLEHDNYTWHLAHQLGGNNLLVEGVTG